MAAKNRTQIKKKKEVSRLPAQDELTELLTSKLEKKITLEKCKLLEKLMEDFLDSWNNLTEAPFDPSMLTEIKRRKILTAIMALCGHILNDSEMEW